MTKEDCSMKLVIVFCNDNNNNEETWDHIMFEHIVLRLFQLLAKSRAFLDSSILGLCLICVKKCTQFIERKNIYRAFDMPTCFGDFYGPMLMLLIVSLCMFICRSSFWRKIFLGILFVQICTNHDSS